MSWDLFVQDLPPGISSTDEIPDDFSPQPIGRRNKIQQAILAAVPTADFSDPAWGNFEGDGFSIEINLGDEEVLGSFALHVRGSGDAPRVIQRILDSVNLRALDTSSPSGLFSLEESSEAFQRWQTYREQTVQQGPEDTQRAAGESNVEPVLRVGGRELWARRLTRPYDFESPCGGEDFVMLLAVFDDAIEPTEQGALSDTFVAQGCRYAVCYGHECSTWDDSIDMSFIATDPDYSPPHDRFVMTTWHDDEPIADVAEFFVRNTSFDNFEAVRFVLVALGGTSKQFDQIRDVVERHFRRQ